MSAIEYNSLVFKISQRVDELNVLSHLRFMFRGRLASGSEDNIHDALSLFKELEEQNILGADRLVEMKELLSDVEEWSLLEKVENFESKRKEYRNLLEQIILSLGELNELERLIAMCRGKISEESEGHIHDVRSLFKELENENNLGIYHLDILKAILAEIENNELLNEVEKFEERRKQEAAIKRKKAKAAAFVSSVRNTLTGVLNIKTVFKAVAVVSTAELLIGWSTYDQLVTAVNTCVLPAGTSVVNLTDGCVCLTVQAETLSALTTLWNLYQDGTLERRLYNFFVTDEVIERAGEETIDVNVSIDEEEYDKARLELMNEAQDAASLCDGKTIRRNSDSDVYSRSKEELPLLKLKHAETELKFHKERIAVIVREIAEELSPEILEECSPDEKATFLKQNEIWKGREVGEMNEKTDKPEMSLRSKPKSMDPEKFDLVQKYLEDIQDARSMTTEVSDSALATHTAASEIGTEEINEADKLCLKDLGSDVTNDLDRRLEADKAAVQKFYQFFGLKLGYGFGLTELKDLFPDTTVSVLKKCFEALRMYDLAEIMEKVRPRCLRPAVSPEQIEILRRTDDRPSKYHSHVAVLVVDFTVEGDTFEREDVKKIETFFKDLNSRNEVAITSFARSEENRKVLREVKMERSKMAYYQLHEAQLKSDFEIRVQRKAQLEKTLDKMVMESGLKQKPSRRNLGAAKQKGVKCRGELEKVVKMREQAERDFEKMKELEKEATKPFSMAIDGWIHNQEISVSCFTVFVIGDDELYSEALLEEHVFEKLALIPDHAKIVVSPWEFRSIAKFLGEPLRAKHPALKVPETLHVKYLAPGHHAKVYRDAGDVSFFTRMIEIFNKRWQTLDLISMMQELRRTVATDYRRHYMYDNFISIMDSLSTLPTFQKKEEEHSS